MPLTPSTKLGPYEILAPSVRVAWDKSIVLGITSSARDTGETS